MQYTFPSDRYAVTVTEGGQSRPVSVYTALICDGDGNNKKLPPEIFAEFDGLGMGTNTTPTYFASFEAAGAARVSVRLGEDVETVTVKPHVPYTYCRETGELVLTLLDEQNLVVQPNGDIFGGLHLFCNRKRTYVPNKPRVIEFAAGVHTVENSPHIEEDEHGNPVVTGIESDTLIYLHDGATVCASIELKGVENVTVAGTGVLSTVHRCHGAASGFTERPLWGSFRYYAKPSILIRSGCRGIEVTGVVLNSEFRNVVIRNSHHITLKNVKMFGSVENGDGVNCYNTCDLLVDGCYIYSCDDCFCLYNACDSIPTLFDEGYPVTEAVSRNVEVKNCLMCSASRPVVIGGHATGATEPRCLIERVRMHDCYIMETPKRIFGCPRERESRWSGHLRLLSQSEQIVRDIEFSDIRVDYTKGCISKPIHIEVRSGADASYTESRGYRIENIRFRNVTFGGDIGDILPPFVGSRPSEDEEGVGVYGVTLEKVTVNGQPLTRECFVTAGEQNIHDLRVE